MNELNAVQSLLDTFDQWLVASLSITIKDIRRSLKEIDLKNKVCYECIDLLYADIVGNIAHSAGKEYTVVSLLVPSGNVEERIALMVCLYNTIATQQFYRLGTHDDCRDRMRRMNLPCRPAVLITIPFLNDRKQTDGKIVTQPLLINMQEK